MWFCIVSELPPVENLGAGPVGYAVFAITGVNVLMAVSASGKGVALDNKSGKDESTARRFRKEL